MSPPSSCSVTEVADTVASYFGVVVKFKPDASIFIFCLSSLSSSVLFGPVRAPPVVDIILLHLFFCYSWVYFSLLLVDACRLSDPYLADSEGASSLASLEVPVPLVRQHRGTELGEN